MTLSGSMGFLDSGNQSADVQWLCVLTSTEQVTPELKIERLVKGKTDAKVKLTLTENGTGGASAVGPKGEVTLAATKAPTTSGGFFVFSFTLSARAGGPGVTYVMSAKTGTDDFAEIARVGAASFQRPQLNTGAPVNLLLKEAPVPRLSVGINQAKPRDPGKSYKGFVPGDVGADRAVTGTVGALQSLLFRLFVILDTPGTLDPLWDQQSLTVTSDSLSEAKFQADKVRVAEELWARQVTEMLAFTPYGGPSAQYTGGCTDIELIMSGIKAKAPNPRYGIYFGCQHLANFGVFSRGLQDPATSAVFPSGILLEANAGCVDTVMDMGGAWIDSSSPPKARDKKPGADPGLLSDGGKSPNLTSVITGTFTANGKTFKYQPGSVHLFSNRPARKAQNDKYEEAVQKFANKIPQGKNTFCAIVTSAKGTIKKTKPGDSKPTETVRTAPRELCMNVLGVSATFEAADLMVSPATGKLFVGHNVAAPIAPHLGFALRTRKNRVQTFDTGGFRLTSSAGGVQRTDGVTAVPLTALFHGGNYDDPLGNVITGAHPFRGTGVFPPVDEAAATTMRDHVLNVLRKARPLGVAKLVLLKPAGVPPASLLARVVYSSPLLNMYDGSSDESNYAISRYMWSLRNLPGAADMTVVWLIYAPTRDLASQMRDSPRSKSLITIAKELSGLSVGTGKDRKLHDFILARLNPAVQVESQSDGTVKAIVEGKGQRHPTTVLIDRGELFLDRAFGPSIPNQPKYFNG